MYWIINRSGGDDEIVLTMRGLRRCLRLVNRRAAWVDKWPPVTFVLTSFEGESKERKEAASESYLDCRNWKVNYLPAWVHLQISCQWTIEFSDRRLARVWQEKALDSRNARPIIVAWHCTKSWLFRLFNGSSSRFGNFEFAILAVVQWWKPLRN